MHLQLEEMVLQFIFFLYQKKDELTKNRRENDEAEEGGLMFERRDDPMCPVHSFEKYLTFLTKLNPKCSFFFQRPKKHTITNDEEIWYDDQCNGKCLLGSKMKTISKLAGLSLEYTNHSIRATSVTILDQCDFKLVILCV